VLDFDRDGDLDLVGAKLDSEGTSYWLLPYRNEGQGRFQEMEGWDSACSGWGPQCATEAQELLIEVGHLDDDSYPDVLVSSGLNLDTYLGRGDGWFDCTRTLVPAVPTALAVADIDLDGIDDRIWASAGYLRLATSTGVVGSLAHQGLSPRTLRVLVRDAGGQDVFLLGFEDGVRVVFGSPGTGLVLGPFFRHGIPHAMLDAGDVDGDGDIDAVVFGMRMQAGQVAGHAARVLPDLYRVLRRTGPSSWRLETPRLGGPAEFLRDVDGDGDLDGVCCSGGGGGGPYFEPNLAPSDYQVSLNDGSGNFAPAFSIPGVGSPQLAGVADFDGDGDVDLAAGRCVYFARGPIRPPARLPGMELPEPQAVLDLDGDGDVDVLATFQGCYRNDGTGRFTAEEHALVAPPSGTVFEGPGYAGDFDGDGDPDLLVKHRSGSGELFGSVLLANDGSGAFPLAQLATAPGVTFAPDALEAGDAFAADLEADGDLDLVTRSLLDSSTSVWVNSGSGSFAAVQVLAGKRVEFVGDVDWIGSEKPDLLLGTIPSGSSWGFYGFYLFENTQPVGETPSYSDVWLGGYYTPYVPAARVAVGDLATWAHTPGLEWASIEPTGYGFGRYDNRYYRADARLYARDLDGDGSDDVLSGPLSTGLDGEREERVPILRLGPGWWDEQILEPGLPVDVDGDGDLDLLGREITLNRANDG
jgi:hypothetical protein